MLPSLLSGLPEREDELQNCVSGCDYNDSEGYAATLPESVISQGLGLF